MIQRKTQTPAYWDDEFTITPDDLQYLSTLLIEDELPRSAEELGRALVLQRVREEEALVQRALSKGTLYQPKKTFQMGEEVVFPALDYRVGQVIDLRPGHNPEYGSFQVIEVQFETGRNREFASDFDAEHPLNSDIQTSTSESQTLKTPKEIEADYGPQVGRMLAERLEAESDFVRLAGEWFRRDLLVEVNTGHMNLAEAVLDMQGGGPLPTHDLLGDLELPEEITPQLRTFSLNYALQEDTRFDEVGPTGEVLWFLHSMEPEGVKTTPAYLKYAPFDYDPALLTSEMIGLERDLDDEWSNLDPPTQVSEPVTIVLTYPHWKSGTLPLSSRLSHVFPTGRTQRIRFTLIDGETNTEIPAWVVRKGRYVYGLEEWYRSNNTPVGAYLELEQGEKPGVVIIRRSSQRPRREWIRIALPINGRLTFEMRKQLIPCKYDELMIVAGEDSQAIDQVWVRTKREHLSLKQLVTEIFPELAKLSPQGTVHAATLYSALNIAIRTPPGPMLAELVSSGTYSPVGDNYWVLRLGGV